MTHDVRCGQFIRQLSEPCGIAGCGYYRMRGHLIVPLCPAHRTWAVGTYGTNAVQDLTAETVEVLTVQDVLES